MGETKLNKATGIICTSGKKKKKKKIQIYLYVKVLIWMLRYVSRTYAHAHALNSEHYIYNI